MAKNKIQKAIEDAINKRLEGIPTYILEFGVFAGTEKDKRKSEPSKGKKKTKVDTEKGLTNAEIMFIMENGSPANHVPSRPVLKLTKEYALSTFVPDAEKQIIKMWLNGATVEDIDKEVGKLALRIEAYVKTGIRRRKFDLMPNALSTIEAKGSDIPLFDTGQLVKSIQCRWHPTSF